MKNGQDRYELLLEKDVLLSATEME
jgi:hypothetical protein